MYFSFQDDSKEPSSFYTPSNKFALDNAHNISVATKLELIGFFCYKADYYLCKNGKSFKDISAKNKEAVIEGIGTVVNSSTCYLRYSNRYRRYKLFGK